MGDTVKATFDIDRVVFEQFKRLTAEEGRSMTWYVNGAIREIVERQLGASMMSWAEEEKAKPVQGVKAGSSKPRAHRAKSKS